jgi:hypothetical protein
MGGIFCQQERILTRINKLLLSVGAMKAGTTWLYRQLEQHPGISFSREKELHYLAFAQGHRKNLNLQYRLSRWSAARRRAADSGTRLPGPDVSWYLDYLLMPRTWHWYERRFAGARPEQYCADFSNLSALLSESAWEELLGRVGELRLLYVLRDPLDRVWSHLKFHYQLGDAQEQLAHLARYESTAGLPERELIDHSLYACNLQRILRVVPREHVHIILYEQIDSDPVGVLRDVEAFLGLDPYDYNPAKLQRRINASASLERPAWVKEHFMPLLAQDLRNLQELNVSVPESWCA